MARRVEELLTEALNFPAGAPRDAFLRKATQETPDLRTDVEELLRIHEESGEFLQRSVLEQDPTLVSTVDFDAADRIELRIQEMFVPDPTGDSLGTIRQFTIQRLLGASSSSTVFLAHDTLLQRDVAIKVLNPHLAVNVEPRKRFLDEARAIAAIRHDNVVSIFEVGEFNGLSFFVMEYFPAGSLQAHLARAGTLSYPDTLKIAIQVAEALAAAQRVGLLHRDVKPSNILIDSFPNRVKLADFGLVCSERNQKSDLSIGTPQFSAPEQIRGESVDHRTDMFGFGCLLYALLVGHSPFCGTSVFQMLQLTLEAQPEPFERFGIHIPPEFEQLVFQLLEKKATGRPASIEQVLHSLRGLEATAHAPASTRRKLLLAAAGLAGVGGMVAFSRWSKSNSSVALAANQTNYFTLYDGRLDSFLYSVRGAKLIQFEELVLREPIHYWRVEQAGTRGEVIYRFEFNQLLAECKINLVAFASFGLDPKCEVAVHAGPDLDHLAHVLRYTRERCEYWPQPGMGPSYPDMPNQGFNTIEGPRQLQDLSGIIQGHKVLFVKAELCAAVNLRNDNGGTLGPAAAQFLRCDRRSNDHPLVIHSRAWVPV